MLEYVIDGGFMMIPLLACSIVGLAVIIDRVRAFRLADTDTFNMRQQVAEQLDAGQTDQAMRICQQHRGPVAAVMLAGLEKFKRLRERGLGATDIEVNVAKTMEDYAPHVLEPLEKRMNLLMLIASISPLLGMTGTVVGMIRSFNVMASAGGLQGAEVAGGISEALITTAAGLLIALPAVVAHNLLTKRIDKFTLDIEASTTEMIDYVSMQATKD